ncbi:Solute carrier family 22 member 24 [Orchesella cincta]|uniref:Solute carrier family 22 member 24 n=1 Tax=Orchesella cincta TaxID=48709 RepID=A0A1D2MBF1_ORCCI|nr:Solute carrier family 22 member 24 [Orchesella cincta]
MGDHGSSGGFEAAFKLVGGSGRFQWYCIVLCSIQLLMMTWNHMGYIFIGAVPKHWCHVSELANSSWSEDQVKNISIPKIPQNGANGAESDVKYEQCRFYNLDFAQILSQSGGNFEAAYELAHHDQQEGHSSAPVAECQTWSYDKSLYLSTIVSEFDLVCDRRYMVATIQASYMIGAFLGTLVFGPLNDRLDAA